LSETTVVFRIQGRENVTETVRLSTELDEEGGQQVAEILLSSVLEVNIEVS
jgi:hypothetical protein